MDVSPAAADVFAEADEALGEPISGLTFDGPEADLNLTINAQPAILATSMAYLAALEERTGFIMPAFYAGHSMGQYSAMVAAGRAFTRRRHAPRPGARRSDAGIRRGRGDGRRDRAAG